MPRELPPPDADARAVSDALLGALYPRIEQAGGCLAFDVYMNAALYEPGLGYYSNGLVPFGAGGDFITAPESGNLLAGCLAHSFASVLEQLDGGEIIELGAGSGVLAADLLEALDGLGVLPARYSILERSAAMRALQAETLRDRLPRLFSRLRWIDALPERPVRGVVFGNEVADALPVKRFVWRDGEVREQGVGRGAREGLSDCERGADSRTAARVQALAAQYGWRGEYRSEYCPALPAWVDELAGCIGEGLLLLIDYGYGRAEYYHPQRCMGTLMCHYRHNAHGDALLWPGLQDITAFVDFTAVAEAADAAGMRLAGYSSQAQFLAASGIDRLLAAVDPGDTRRFLRLGNEAKRLMLPGEMGERFKVIGFTRDLPRPVTGFGGRDLRGRL